MPGLFVRQVLLCSSVSFYFWPFFAYDQLYRVEWLEAEAEAARGEDGPEESRERESPLGVVPLGHGMPQAWDKRFVRTHEKRGLEVRLLARCSSGDQLWVVVKPDLGLSTISLKNRAAVGSSQRVGIYYTAFPALAAGAKSRLEGDGAALAANAGPEPLLQPWRPGAARTGRWLATAFVAMVATGPSRLCSLLRHCLRSRTRAAGLAGGLWLLHLTVARSGLADWVIGSWDEIRRGIAGLADLYRESSEALDGALEALESVRRRLGEWGLDLWGGLLTLLALGSACYAGLEALAGDGSPGSSPGGSRPLTPEPPASPPSAAPASAGSVPGQEMQLVEAITRALAQREAEQERVLGRVMSRLEQALGPLAQRVASVPAEAPPPPPPPEPPREAANEEELRRMRERLEAVERLIQEDGGGSPGARGASSKPPEAPPVPVPSPGPQAGGYVPVMTRLPRGDERSGELEVPREGAPTGGVPGWAAQDLISAIERTTASAHGAFAAELRRYQPVPEAEWPLPEGYRARLAPALLAYIYGRAKTGSEFGSSYLQDHGLEDCYAATELVRILEHFDRLLTSDQAAEVAQAGWINAPSTEYMARRVYGLMEAFRDCKTKIDWCRNPKEKNWKSKVNWRRCDRIDPRSQERTSGPRLKEVEAELRAVENEEIQRLKVVSRLEEREAALGHHDPLNPSA